MIGVKLPKHKKMSLKEVKTYLDPKSVFFSCEKDELLIKNNQEVKEGETIARRKKFDLPVIASVSGKAKITTKDNIANIEIINNHEKKEYLEDIPYDYTYTKTELIHFMKEAGIVGMGGAGFPTYLKYDTNKKIKTLIINGVECEPYITADYRVSLDHAKEIIKTIHWIMKTLSIQECFIAIKVHNPLLKEKLFTIADKYKKIKVIEVPNLYPMGWEKSLVRYIKHTDYKTIPLEKGIVVNNISTIYAVHNVLKHHKPLTERMVTFTGEGMKNPCNVQVKIGTKVSEVIEYLGGVKNDSIYISGGPMMGEHKKLEEMIVTPDLNCILIKEGKEHIESICLKCGKCVDNCPAKLAPVLIHENQDEEDILKHLHPEKCIECGICSFICPAKIDVREHVKEAKKKGMKI